MRLLEGKEVNLFLRPFILRYSSSRKEEYILEKCANEAILNSMYFQSHRLADLVLNHDLLFKAQINKIALHVPIWVVW